MVFFSFFATVFQSYKDNVRDYAELQIREVGGTEDHSKIILLISK